jgi:hypothetical protein
MKVQPPKVRIRSHREDTEEDSLLPESGNIALPIEEPASESRRRRKQVKIIANARRIKDWIVSAMNPPLVGGILAVCFGLIPWFHTEFFGAGVLSPYVFQTHLFDAPSQRVSPVYLTV